jgi:shikimate dehydrogenase
MKRACVIGWPIEHSRSPLIHTYWLRRYAIEGSYEKVAVKPDAAAGFLTSLAQHGFVGCNVTVPHKETAFAVADEREASAEAVGAANTAWLVGGRLHVANTDTYGFMTNLSCAAPDWQRRDAPVLVLGAGGAARAIVYGFLEAGVGEVRVCNRTRERAEALAQTFGSCVRVWDWTERNAAAREASVLVNTTTIGMKGEGTLGLDLAQLLPDCVVCDLVYVPLETQLLAAARARGLAVVDGLGMLLHQAVPGFERWFGARPEVTDELRHIVVADIEGR